LHQQQKAGEGGSGSKDASVSLDARFNLTLMISTIYGHISLDARFTVTRVPNDNASLLTDVLPSLSLRMGAWRAPGAGEECGPQTGTQMISDDVDESSWLGGGLDSSDLGPVDEDEVYTDMMDAMGQAEEEVTKMKESLLDEYHKALEGKGVKIAKKAFEEGKEKDLAYDALMLVAEMKGTPESLRPAIEADLDSKIQELGVVGQALKKVHTEHKKETSEQIDTLTVQKKHLAESEAKFKVEVQELTVECDHTNSLYAKLETDSKEEIARLQAVIDKGEEERGSMHELVQNFQGRTRGFNDEIKAAESKKDEEIKAVRDELAEQTVLLANREEQIKKNQELMGNMVDQDAKMALEMAQNVAAENVRKWEVDVAKMRKENAEMKAKALADEVEMATMQSKLFGDYEKMSFNSGNKNAELEALNKKLTSEVDYLNREQRQARREIEALQETAKVKATKATDAERQRVALLTAVIAAQVPKSLLASHMGNEAMVRWEVLEQKFTTETAKIRHQTKSIPGGESALVDELNGMRLRQLREELFSCCDWRRVLDAAVSSGGASYFPERMRTAEALKEAFLDLCREEYIGLAAEAGEKAASGEEKVNWGKALNVYTITVGQKPDVKKLHIMIESHIAKRPIDMATKEQEISAATARLLAEHEHRADEALESAKKVHGEQGLLRAEIEAKDAELLQMRMSKGGGPVVAPKPRRTSVEGPEQVVEEGVRKLKKGSTGFVEDQCAHCGEPLPELCVRPKAEAQRRTRQTSREAIPAMPESAGMPRSDLAERTATREADMLRQQLLQRSLDWDKKEAALRVEFVKLGERQQHVLREMEREIAEVRGSLEEDRKGKASHKVDAAKAKLALDEALRSNSTLRREMAKVTADAAKERVKAEKQVAQAQADVKGLRAALDAALSGMDPENALAQSITAFRNMLEAREKELGELQKELKTIDRRHQAALDADHAHHQAEITLLRGNHQAALDAKEEEILEASNQLKILRDKLDRARRESTDPMMIPASEDLLRTQEMHEDHEEDSIIPPPSNLLMNFKSGSPPWPSPGNPPSGTTPGHQTSSMGTLAIRFDPHEVDPERWVACLIHCSIAVSKVTHAVRTRLAEAVAAMEMFGDQVAAASGNSRRIEIGPSLTPEQHDLSGVYNDRLEKLQVLGSNFMDSGELINNDAFRGEQEAKRAAIRVANGPAISLKIVSQLHTRRDDAASGLPASPRKIHSSQPTIHETQSSFHAEEERRDKEKRKQRSAAFTTTTEPLPHHRVTAETPKKIGGPVRSEAKKPFEPKLDNLRPTGPLPEEEGYQVRSQRRPGMQRELLSDDPSRRLSLEDFGAWQRPHSVDLQSQAPHRLSLSGMDAHTMSLPPPSPSLRGPGVLSIKGMSQRSSFVSGPLNVSEESSNIDNNEQPTTWMSEMDPVTDDGPGAIAG